MGNVIQVRAAEAPAGQGDERSDAAIRTDAVHVVYTSVEDTLAAVRVAGTFARTLGVPVTIVHIRAVPYPLPVEQPTGVSPAETDAFLARLRAEDLDASVRVHLCREARRAIPAAFKPHSLIVVAGQRAWWPTEAEWWRRILEAAGHFVVFVDRSEHGVCDPTVRKESSHA